MYYKSPTVHMWERKQYILLTNYQLNQIQCFCKSLPFHAYIHVWNENKKYGGFVL